MSYSHYVRCPKCHGLSITENHIPLELLAEGRANVTIDCKHCGFSSEYRGISAKSLRHCQFLMRSLNRNFRTGRPSPS
jgi:predicted nucleic-acid-binding Zn-ribbon protein